MGTGFTFNFSQNGYQKLPSGLIIQWFLTQVAGETQTSTVTLPVTFPNACLNAGATLYRGTQSNAAGAWVTDIRSSTVTVTISGEDTLGASNVLGFAIGY